MHTFEYMHTCTLQVSPDKPAKLDFGSDSETSINIAPGTFRCVHT